MFLFYQHYIQLVRRFSVVLLLLDGGNALPNIPYANVQCNLQGGQLLIQLLISLLHGYAYNRHRQSQFLFSHAYSRSDLQFG